MKGCSATIPPESLVLGRIGTDVLFDKGVLADLTSLPLGFKEFDSICSFEGDSLPDSSSPDSVTILCPEPLCYETASTSIRVTERASRLSRYFDGSRTRFSKVVRLLSVVLVTLYRPIPLE